MAPFLSSLIFDRQAWDNLGEKGLNRQGVLQIHHFEHAVQGGGESCVKPRLFDDFLLRSIFEREGVRVPV